MLRRIALLCLLPLLLCSACGEPVPEEFSSLEESSAPQRITTIYPTWSTDDIYTAGDIVVHNGGYYRALWWSQGNEPTADTERDEWQYLGEVPVTGARCDCYLKTDFVIVALCLCNIVAHKL